MADTATIKQAITQEVVETAKATVLMISGEGRSQSTNTEQKGPTEATRHITGPP